MPGDATPLDGGFEVILAARQDAVDLRRVDCARAAEPGCPAARVIERVKASGLAVVCCTGTWVRPPEAVVLAATRAALP